MKTKRILFMIFSVMMVASLLLSACVPAATEEPTKAPTEAPAAAAPTEAPAEEAVAATEAPAEAPAEAEPLVVGLMTDKSGALAIYGPSQTNGFYLGLEYATGGTMEVAGRPIQVIEKDNGSDPETGVTQARELIEAEGAEIIVGNISSGVALAVMPVVEENDVIFIAEPAAAPQITADNFSPNTFRTSRTSYQDALVMGTGLLDMGATFVQIAPDYAFGYGSACSFYPVVKGGGGEFAVNDTAEGCGTIFAPVDTTDFTPYINQILETNADVLIVTWAGAGFAPLFQQMGQLGVFDEMVVGTGVGDNQTLAAGYADAVGSMGIQVYHYTLPNNEINDWLVQRHIEEYGTPPDLWAAGGMMAAIMLVQGVDATEGDASAEALINVYEDNFSFEGPKGAVTIRPYDHVALQSLYFVQIDNVTDPDLKFVKLLKEFAPEESAPPCQLPEAYADRCPAVEAAPEVEYPFAGQDVVIGLMTDKSGALAIYGPSQTNGFYLGLEYATNGSMEVAGRPIVVIEKNNGSDPETGVNQARELIEAEGAEIIVGNISSGVALAVMPVVEENDVIFIAEPAAAPQITADNFSPNTFRTSRTSYQDALVMGTGLLDMGQTFVQIAPDYAFGYGSACSFYPVVKAGGGEFVVNDTAEGCGTIFAPVDTTDFTPYINQILDSGADVLIVTWAGAGFAPLFQQMGQLGVFDEMVVGTGVGDNQTLAAGYADAVGSMGIQVYHYTLPNNEINDWLVQRHIEEYGTPPDLWAAGGMMAAIMVVEGLETSAGDASAEALIGVYENEFGFDGPKGPVIIRSYDHVALQTLYFVQIDNVTDPELKFVKLVKEFSPEESAPPCQLPEAYADRCP